MSEGWLSRLKGGLGKSSDKLTQGIAGIFTKEKLDEETIEKLEELLIEADMGAKVAAELSGKLAESRFDKGISPDEVKKFLAGEIAAMLSPLAVPFVPDAALRP